MIIRKLTASFGKLENESLRFHDGLNVIYAPNESGKSTWCAFIRAMLYGVDSSERERRGYLPDKLRYAPWSGAPMEGSMELTSDNCNITITRATRTKNAPMREFSACYTGTTVPVEGLNGTNAGEELTGVSKDVFRRSAFVEQGTVAVTGSPELEKRISAIVSTGEESASYTEADERLRAWQRKRRANRRGLLPELEGRMDEAQRLLDDLDRGLEDKQQLEEQLKKARADCTKLEAAVTETRKRQRKAALEELNAGRAELKAVSEENDEAIAALSHRRAELRAGPFGDRSPREVEAEINADRARLEELNAPAPSKRILIPTVILFVLAVLAAALYAPLDAIALVIAAGVFCVAAVALLMRYLRMRQDDRAAREESAAILLKYKVGEAEELEGLLQRHRALCAEVVHAMRAEEASRVAYEEAKAQQEQREARAISALDFSSGSSDAARLGRALAAARANVETLSGRIASLEGRLSTLGDPLVLSSSLSFMREEYDQLQEEYDALSLAVDTLRDADAEIQSRFSPELGRVASRYMSAVTGGRYEDVLLNRDFTARTRTRDDIVARDSEYLSAGTLDLLYLAVRLAVCELALPEGEPCPLIIDDALVNLDETRYAQAIELLKQIARQRQVILFTCRQPEAPAASEQPALPAPGRA